MRVIDQSGRISYMGLAFTGRLLTDNDVYNNRVFNWTWTLTNYSYIQEEFNPRTNNTYNKTYYGYTYIGDNNHPRFKILQNWTFDPLHDVKTSYYLEQNIGDFLMPKIWFIHINPTDSFRLGNSPISSTQDLDLEGNYSYLRRIDMGAYEFRPKDLYRENYMLENIYMGNGARLGYSGRIMAIGVSRDSIIYDREIITIDPEITDYHLPTDYGNYNNDWTDGVNLLLDDSVFSRAVTDGDLESTESYLFINDVQAGAIINGIQIKADGKMIGAPLCQIVASRSYVCNSTDCGNYVQLSYSSVGEVTKESGWSLFGKNWSSDEIYEIYIKNEKVTNKGFNCRLDLDMVEVRINYTPVYGNPPIITPLDPDNNSVINYTEVPLNVSISDNEGNHPSWAFYSSQYKDYIYEGYYIDNSTSWTSIITNYILSHPKVFNKDNTLWALYHFDNREQYGESQNFVKNFAIEKSVNCTDGAGVYDPIANTSNFNLGHFYDFYGDDDYLMCGQYYYENISQVCNNGCTFNAWAKQIDYGIHYIMGMYPAVTTGRYFVLGTGTGNRTQFTITEFGNETEECQASSISEIPLDTWYMITGVWDDWTGTTKIYYNGALMNTTKCNFYHISLLDWSNFIGYQIGDAGRSIYKVYNLNGSVDEVAVWNRTLTDLEVLDLYRLPHDVPIYWLVNASDGNGTSAKISNFNISISLLCRYDCSKTKVITAPVDCEGLELAFYNQGTIEVTADVFNYAYRSVQNCHVALKDGARFY